jgi:hypothetical protein
VAGVACGLFLNIFYLSLKHVWPQNYFGLSGSVDPVVSRNLARWAVFRLIPPAIAAAAASITAERAGGIYWLAGAVAIVLHVRLLLMAVRSSIQRSYRAAAFQESLVALVITLVMVGAVLARSVFAPIVPEPKDLVSNIWAGFIAAIGAVYLLHVVLLRKKPEDLLERSFAEIPMQLKVHVWRKAQQVGIDPSIPLAVMAAENLQRPSWVRRLERMIPKRLGGTRGIMQQAGALSDVESIDLAFQRNFCDPTIFDTPWVVFTRYNHVPEFWHLASAAHLMLSGAPSALREIEQAAGPPDPGE